MTAILSEGDRAADCSKAFREHPDRHDRRSGTSGRAFATEIDRIRRILTGGTALGDVQLLQPAQGARRDQDGSALRRARAKLSARVSRAPRGRASAASRALAHTSLSRNSKRQAMRRSESDRAPPASAHERRGLRRTGAAPIRSGEAWPERRLQKCPPPPAGLNAMSGRLRARVERARRCPGEDAAVRCRSRACPKVRACPMQVRVSR
jgi:hypothetical protein